MKILLIISFLMCSTLAKAQVSPTDGCDVIKKAIFKKAKLKICEKSLDVELADAGWSREVGLMCRDSLPENSGMIFIFDEERPLTFWMKNTRIPLSIGFFGKNKRLIDTYEMKAMDEQTITASQKKSLYALEANKGWFKKNKIHKGCKFELLTDSPKKL